MNIIQVQDQLKSLPDQALQKELLNPSGAAPSYLVLSELNRRKEMRASYAQKPPSSSMAEEFAQGLGGADVGKYGEAVRGAMPSTPDTPIMAQNPAAGAVPPPPMGQGSQMGQMPPQPQEFASGGYVAPLGQPMPNGGQPMTPMAPMVPGPQMMNPMAPMASGAPTGMPGQAGGVASAVSPAVAPAILGMIGSFDGSAGGATGDGSGNSGEAGGVGAGVGTAAGDAAATAAGTDGGDGQYADGGVVRLQSGGGLFLPPMVPYYGSEKPYDIPLPMIGTRRLEDMPRPRVVPFEYGRDLGVIGDKVSRNWSDIWSSVGNLEGVGRRAIQGSGMPNPPLPVDYPLTEVPTGNDRFAQPPSVYGETNDSSPAPMDPRNAPPRGRDGAPPPASDAPRGTGAGGGGSRGGVGSALNIADQSFEDYLMKMRALAPPDRFERVREQNEADRSKAAAALETDKGLALLQAGLGIMGGQSPFAAVNIGQGAQAGVKYWQEAGRESRMMDQAMRQAEVQMAAAQANNDQRAFDRAATLHAQAEMKKMQLAEMANRAGIAAEDRRAAREDRAADRREAALLREFSTLTAQANSYGTQIKELTRDLKDATLPDDLRKQYQGDLLDYQQSYKAVMGRLNALQNMRDAKLGRTVDNPIDAELRRRGKLQ